MGYSVNFLTETELSVKSPNLLLINILIDYKPENPARGPGFQIEENRQEGMGMGFPLSSMET